MALPTPQAADEAPPVNHLSAYVPGGDEQHNHHLESRRAGRLRRVA